MENKKEKEFEGSKHAQSNFYRNLEKTDPHAGTREEGKPKDINDPFYGTGEFSKPDRENDPTLHKDYDASANSGGSNSATEKPEG